MRDSIEDIDVPESLFGTHFDSALDVRMAIQEVLEHNLPAISPHRDEELELENMPSIVVMETGVAMIFYVPLPYLHHAEITTDQLQRVMAPTLPAAVKLEVRVHPGSDTELEDAENPLDGHRRGPTG